MATSDKYADSDSANDAEPEVNLAGWDPYIVALTADEGRRLAAKNLQLTAASAPAETREPGLMNWLRTHMDHRKKRTARGQGNSTRAG